MPHHLLTFVVTDPSSPETFITGPCSAPSPVQITSSTCSHFLTPDADPADKESLGYAEEVQAFG